MPGSYIPALFLLFILFKFALLSKQLLNLILFNNRLPGKRIEHAIDGRLVIVPAAPVEEKLSVENDWQYYIGQVKKWEEEYPAHQNIIIKRRLQQYLEIVGTVDFSAALKDVNGKMKFVNSTYEYKPAEWKKVYRAGKEVNDVAKSFVTSRIKELQ